MFFVLVWFPVGLLVMSVIMFWLKDEFPVNDFEDFMGNIIMFVFGAIFWPLAIICCIALLVYEFFYER